MIGCLARAEGEKIRPYLATTSPGNGLAIRTAISRGLECKRLGREREIPRPMAGVGG